MRNKKTKIMKNKKDAQLTPFVSTTYIYNFYLNRICLCCTSVSLNSKNIATHVH